tara:strand:- start:715 stop:921 length:207 start_codon:yes stop_codon:yes gene_type:complete
MEALLGSVVAIALSFGYTEIKAKQLRKSQTNVQEVIENYDKEVARKVFAAVRPVSKSVVELQHFTGIR